MHNAPSNTRNRHKLTFTLAVLFILTLSWVLIQTVSAASIYIIEAITSNDTAVAVINERPVVSYYDAVDKNLKFARCGDAACTTFANTIVTVDTADDVGSASSIAVINDKPIIAYVDWTNSDLKVAACDNAACSSATITIVATDVNLATHIDIIAVNGNPLISYFGGAQDLKTAACVDPACALPATITALDTTGIVGTTSSMVLVGDNPVIAYNDFTNSDLKVAACNNSTCTSATITTVDFTGSTGSWNSIAVINGNPIISYSSSSPTATKVLACTNPTCTTFLTPIILEAVSANGTSIAIVNGLPVVAYAPLFGTNYRLKLATCTTVTCSSFTLTNLTSAADSGRYPSMLSLNNQPAISYFDVKNNQVRFYFGGDEGYGQTTTPTPSATLTPLQPTLTPTSRPTLYPTPGQVGTLIPLAPGNTDNFGQAVAVSGDTIVVGAPTRDHSDKTDAGAAYVYQWNGTIWAQQAELVAGDPGTEAYFGNMVSIHDDTILVGAYGNGDEGPRTGAAYVFVRNGTTWSQQARISAPDAAAEARFGFSGAISVDTIILGADGDDETFQQAGAAYIFTRSGTTWTFQQKLLASDPAAGKMFGYAVDLYGDTAIIGSPGPITQTGAAYVFVRAWNSTIWTQQQKLTPNLTYISVGDRFGASVAVYHDSAIVGAPQAEGNVAAGIDDGSIQPYTRLNGAWTAQNQYPYIIPSAMPSSEPQYGGAAVNVYRESYLVGVPGRRVGSPATYPGIVYVLANSDPYIRMDEIKPITLSGRSQFGQAVARDGNIVVVGAPDADYASLSDPGAAYIYRVDAPPWQPTASVTPSMTPTSEFTATLLTPTAPADATIAANFFTIRTPTLTWNRLSWAVGYQIEIDDDPNFGSPLPHLPEFLADTFSYVTPELANGIYYWRVRGRVDAANWGNWSTTQSFTISSNS